MYSLIKKCFVTVNLFVLMFAVSVVSGHEVELDSKAKKFSYTIGINAAASLIRDLEQIGVEVDAEALAAGVLDLISQSELQLSDEEMQTVLQEYQQELEKEQEAMLEQSRQMAEEFVSNFSELEGVQKTDSGILYRIVEEGAGDKPKAEDTVVVHYRGSLVNGTVFDSSYEREQPATFSLQGIIPGWQEILQLMPTGSTWEVVIPPELAYGERGAPPAIPPMATLVFTIELIEIQ